jgi:hypothetical protein
MNTLHLLRRSLLAGLACGLLAATLPAAAAGEYIRPGVSFALIGDTPYGVAEEPKFDRVISDINASRNVRFVLHTGDVKQGILNDQWLLGTFSTMGMNPELLKNLIVHDGLKYGFAVF